MVTKEKSLKNEHMKASFSQPKNLQIKEPELSLNVKGQDLPKDSQDDKLKESSTYQSVEAHRSTACSPVFMFCNISPSTSEDCIITKIWLIIEDSLRIRPMTMHQSRHPASMKMCSKYLHTSRNKMTDAKKGLQMDRRTIVIR